MSESKFITDTSGDRLEISWVNYGHLGEPRLYLEPCSRGNGQADFCLDLNQLDQLIEVLTEMREEMRKAAGGPKQ